MSAANAQPGTAGFAPARLPLHPLYFCSLFVLFVGVLHFGDFHLPNGFTVEKFLLLLVVMMQTVWAARVVGVVAAVEGPQKYPRRRYLVGFMLAGIALGGLGDLAYAIVTGLNAPNNSYFILPGLVAAYSVIHILWLAAWSLCEAEGKPRLRSVVGTFILMVYLVIGAPFLYARVKRLAGADV